LFGIVRVSVSVMMTGALPQLNLIVPPPWIAAKANANCNAVSVQLAAVPLPTVSGLAAPAEGGDANRATKTSELARHLSSLIANSSSRDGDRTLQCMAIIVKNEKWFRKVINDRRAAQPKIQRRMI